MVQEMKDAKLVFYIPHYLNNPPSNPSLLTEGQEETQGFLMTRGGFRDNKILLTRRGVPSWDSLHPHVLATGLQLIYSC